MEKNSKSEEKREDKKQSFFNLPTLTEEVYLVVTVSKIHLL